MAKLNGVKTIDMVNGEITKVEYGGAVYAKVDGNSKRGDVLLRTKRDMDDFVFVGNFYECPKDGESVLTWYIDEEGERLNSLAENFSIFRKVSDVSAPFAEMVMAKVDAVEKRVTALEGAQAEPKVAEKLTVGDRVKVAGLSVMGADHDGEVGKLERIDDDGDHSVRFDCGKERLYRREQMTKVSEHAPKIEEGDRVKALANSEYGDIRAGEFGVVEDLDCGGRRDPYAIGVRADSGIYCYFRPQDLELVAESETLKVGDYVVPLPEADEEYSITDTSMTLGKVVVGRHHSGDDIRVEVVKHEREDEIGDDYSVMSKYFRKATDDEVAAATAPAKPKAGDIVVITANTNASRNAVGDIGKVGDTLTSQAEVDVPGKTKGNGNWTRYDEMRLATPAEIAKYESSLVQVEKDAMFAKAGRKPNEYRKGDVVRYIGNSARKGSMAEVVRDSDGSRVQIIMEPNRFAPKSTETFDSVEIVCFAENRVDAKEVA